MTCTNCDSPSISIQPPPLTASLLPVSSLNPFNPTILPAELVQTLNHAFFLHLLATDPDRVLPPGKSLLSMMSAPRSRVETEPGEIPKLEERVKDLVHGAFWREVRSSIFVPFILFVDFVCYRY